MKRKIIPSVIVSLILIASLIFTFTVFGNDVTWRYDSETKTLYISGSGAMDDYENSYDAPWNPHILSVENVVVEDGVTSVGAYAFSGAEKLSNVTLADSVKSINAFAFASCPSLSELTLSENVTTIADYSFAYDGINLKDFTVNTTAGSYALHYVIKNNKSSENHINFTNDKVECGEHIVRITQSGGMFAYYPYTPKYSGTYKFYSTGSHDTRGYIYNDEYRQIAYNDDGGSGTNFLISSITLEKGKTYYFGAKIMNSSLKGSFSAFIEPVEFDISGTIYAMNDPSGAASDIVITEALLDGVATDGEYERTVTPENAEAVITVGDREYNYTFSPDKDADIVLMVCDINNDGYVNGRDYAYLKTSDSKYKPLFENFIGYTV